MLLRPVYFLFRWALTWASRTFLAANILEVFAALSYPLYIWMLKGVLFSLFTSSLRLISWSTIFSSAELISGLEYCLLSNAHISASVLTPWVRPNLGLQNYLYSEYPCLPSADSRRAVVSFWQKNVHNTGKRLRRLSLPSKRVVR